jgi:hypothetical protein
VSEHVLGAGRQVIDSLELLGHALGYAVEREWPLPESTAAVDVAWLRTPADAAPLLAFEIESRPGEGLASNAMKVLGRDAADGAKPLHLFHVVVTGGLRSRRPTATAREFAGHNYSVHLLASPREPSELLVAILAAHRRVASTVDGAALGSALRASLWTGLSAAAVMRYVDDAGFAGVRGLPVATLALRDSEFRSTLIRHLMDTWGDVLEGDRPPPNRYLGAHDHRYATYGSYMAEAACEGLELGLIACLSPRHGEAAFRALQGWQRANHIGDSPGPFSGAGVQWTAYAINHLGYYWALVAALFAQVPSAQPWCANQPLKLLHALRSAPSIERALLALWVMHALPDEARYAGTYETAVQAVRDVGGLAGTWIARPNPTGPDPESAEEEEWTAVAPHDASALTPASNELRLLVRNCGADPGDPVDLALRALVEDPAMRPADGAELAAFLASLDAGAAPRLGSGALDPPAAGFG